MEEKNINMEQPDLEQVEFTESKKENIIENIEEKSATPISSEGSIGKFKDAESLLNAYNNLQAEFTRKCQKLSELETRESEVKNTDNNQFVELNDELKNSLIESYLESLQKTNTPKVIADTFGSGIPLKTPPTPKNLEEAKSVVRNLLI